MAQFDLKNLAAPLTLVGAGKMGGAMLTGWLAQGLDPSRVTVIDPYPSDEIRALQAKGLKLNPPVPAKAATLVVAVKPQMFRETAATLRNVSDASTLVVSIMAGITIASLREFVSGTIVRAMPNTPAAIGRGITVAVSTRELNGAQRAIADALLRAAGSVEWVEDEALMAAVTAVSGSGPAYVFLLAEELAKAGVAAGLPISLATRLARETVSGSGELLRQSALDASTLRQNVTSPNGTTAAALGILMADDGISQLMIRAIAAAARRSRELSS